MVDASVKERAKAMRSTLPFEKVEGVATGRVTQTWYCNYGNELYTEYRLRLTLPFFRTLIPPRVLAGCHLSLSLYGCRSGGSSG